MPPSSCDEGGHRGKHFRCIRRRSQEGEGGPADEDRYLVARGIACQGEGYGRYRRDERGDAGRVSQRTVLSCALCTVVVPYAFPYALAEPGSGLSVRRSFCRQSKPTVLGKKCKTLFVFGRTRGDSGFLCNGRPMLEADSPGSSKTMFNSSRDKGRVARRGMTVQE